MNDSANVCSFADKKAKRTYEDAVADSIVVESTPASRLQVRGLNWFWKDRIARGKLALLGGLPDRGKSLLALDIIARATTGGAWPCNEGTAPRGNVILMTAEDDIEDTVAPRLKAAGADLSKVHIVRMAKTLDGRKRMFNLGTDLTALQRKVDEIGDVVLIVIDPISAYLGVGMINNASTTDVRGVLSPLTDLVAKMKIVALGIMHFNKKADVTNAMLRIADSLAYVAAARHVYVVVDDVESDEKGRRLFVKAKNNLAPDADALSYTIIARPVGTDADTGKEIWAPYVIWGDERVEVSATQAMQAEAAGKKKDSDALSYAKDFLRSKLCSGPVDSAELNAEAQICGIALRTLKRAKAELGITARQKPGMHSGWQCELPPAAEPKRKIDGFT